MENREEIERTKKKKELAKKVIALREKYNYRLRLDAYRNEYNALLDEYGIRNKTLQEFQRSRNATLKPKPGIPDHLTLKDFKAITADDRPKYTSIADQYDLTFDQVEFLLKKYRYARVIYPGHTPANLLKVIKTTSLAILRTNAREINPNLPRRKRASKKTVGKKGKKKSR